MEQIIIVKIIDILYRFLMGLEQLNTGIFEPEDFVNAISPLIDDDPRI